MLHKNAVVGEIHPIHNWSVANTAARTALVVTAADIGKVCRQLDDDTFYLLRDTGPNVWTVFADEEIGVVAPYIQLVSTNAAVSGAVTLDPTLGDFFELTLIGNVTLNVSPGLNGQNLVARLKQDATGSRIFTAGANLTFGSDITEVVLSTLAGKFDYLGLRYHSVSAKWHVVGLIKGY